jgi:hypothetical protein
MDEDDAAADKEGGLIPLGFGFGINEAPLSLEGGVGFCSSKESLMIH